MKMPWWRRLFQRLAYPAWWPTCFDFDHRRTDTMPTWVGITVNGGSASYGLIEKDSHYWGTDDHKWVESETQQVLRLTGMNIPIERIIGRALREAISYARRNPNGDRY